MFWRWPVARTGCTSPVARHRLHVTSADPVAPLAVTGCTSPAGRLLVSGPAGRHRWPVARHRLHVTSADPLPRWPSPAGRHPLQCHRFYLLVSGPAGRHRWPVARHRLHVTSADPVAPLAVTGCTSPAGRLLVSGPAGRHRWPVARHRLHVTSADPLPRWPSPVARHPLAGCTSPVARHVSGPVAPLAVTRWPVARQRTRWPSPLAGCSSPVARHVSGPVAPLAVTRWPSPVAMSPVLSARQRTRCTSADPLAGCSSRLNVTALAGCSSVERHPLAVTRCNRSLG